MPSPHLTRRAILASTVLAIPTVSLARVQGATYKDPKAPVDIRVRDLLSRMTLEEKAQQLRCLWVTKSQLVDRAGTFSTEKASIELANGIGQIARPSDRMGAADFFTNSLRSIADTVAFTNAVQKHLVENTRLGIPALFHEETAHGLAAKDATVFPSPPALGSTWDPDLVEKVFAVAGREARVRGATVALGPVIDLAREPRWGRVEEFFGEDPYHVGQMGIAAVRGQQGPVRPLGKEKVFVTLKHFVHASPQGGINLAPADISERALRENYLAPFEFVLKATDPAAIMPSYNEVEGIPAHASRKLLTETGRGRLGFKGVYFSDYEGITNLQPQHKIVASADEAAVLSLKAGVDAELPEGRAFKRLPELVRSGRIPETTVDAAVARVLKLKFEAGLFEAPYVDADRALRETNTPADISLARTAAQKSIVLLKNDGVLPLDNRVKMKLAVIGPNAQPALFGGYSGENDKAVGVLDGIKAAAGPNVSVEYAEGVQIIAPQKPGLYAPMAIARPADPERNKTLIAEAAALAARSDAVVIVLGDRPVLTREAISEGVPGDRNSLDLYGDQNALFAAVAAAGKPVVAVLLNGRPLSVNLLAAKANALVEGWYLGQEGGNAMADVLFGKVNPGGKLPVSFARSVGELPAYYNRHPSTDINKYIEGKRTPLFPFGHGLSFTKFEISAPRLAKAQIAVGESVDVEVDVKNTGSRVGDEVVQLYLRDQISSAPRPVLELKGFKRVTLKPGETRTVRFKLNPDALAFWDIEMNWSVEPGDFLISAGPSSAELKTTTLTVV